MPLTVQELLENHYGTNMYGFRDPLGTTSIGTTATQIMRQNPNRFAFTVINLSTNTLYINTRSTVSSTDGIRVSASGGSAFFEWRLDGELPSREWFAIATGASSAIWVLTLVSI